MIWAPCVWLGAVLLHIDIILEPAMLGGLSGLLPVVIGQILNHQPLRCNSPANQRIVPFCLLSAFADPCSLLLCRLLFLPLHCPVVLQTRLLAFCQCCLGPQAWAAPALVTYQLLSWHWAQPWVLPPLPAWTLCWKGLVTGWTGLSTTS